MASEDGVAGGQKTRRGSGVVRGIRKSRFRTAATAAAAVVDVATAARQIRCLSNPKDGERRSHIRPRRQPAEASECASGHGHGIGRTGIRGFRGGSK